MGWSTSPSGTTTTRTTARNTVSRRSTPRVGDSSGSSRWTPPLPPKNSPRTPSLTLTAKRQSATAKLTGRDVHDVAPDTRVAVPVPVFRAETRTTVNHSDPHEVDMAAPTPNSPVDDGVAHSTCTCLTPTTIHTCTFATAHSTRRTDDLLTDGTSVLLTPTRSPKRGSGPVSRKCTLIHSLPF